MTNINNAIVIVDDDEDDLTLIAEAYAELGTANKLVLLHSADELTAYLQEHELSPFFILCDYYMPGTTGMKLRESILNNPQTRYKSVPFLLWSTGAELHQVREAYDKLIQGFFIKPSSFEGIKNTLRLLIEYWTASQHPKPLTGDV